MASRLTQLESAALGFSCQPCGWRAEQGLNLEDREGRCQGRWGTAGMLEAEKEVGCRRVPSEGAGATVAPRRGGLSVAATSGRQYLQQQILEQ